MIVFMGAFFLLNLLMAVINSEFSKAMDSKMEASKPKRKKLDDAPSSSEDEDEKVALLQEQLIQLENS